MNREEYKINDIYIGFQKKEEYNEYLDEFELWEDYILLEKTKYGMFLENKGFDIYKDINTEEKLYVNKEGLVINSTDEVTGEETYDKIVGIISIRDLLDKFKNDKREDSQYRDYVFPLYNRVCTALNGDDSINKDYLNDLFGSICDIYSYTFSIYDEEDYENYFGCRIYDFTTGSRVRK